MSCCSLYSSNQSAGKGLNFCFYEVIKIIYILYVVESMFAALGFFVMD